MIDFENNPAPENVLNTMCISENEEYMQINIKGEIISYILEKIKPAD